MKIIFKALVFSGLCVSVCQSDDDKFDINDYSELIKEFSQLCFLDGEPASLFDCQGPMSEKIDSYDNLNTRELAELAAIRITLEYAKEINDTQLYESTRSQVETKFVNDIYANLLSRVYAITLLDQGRYLEAYTLQERSALVEKNAVTHQTAAMMLRNITLKHLHELEVSHLQRAFDLSSTDQHRLQFGNQLHRALVNYNMLEEADQFKSKLANEENYQEMAAKYARMLVANEITNKEAPRFCQPYSFGLISDDPCRAFISVLEDERTRENILPDRRSMIEAYLRSSYFSLVEAARATEEEREKFDKLSLLSR